MPEVASSRREIDDRHMPDEISRDDILARLRAQPADDPLRASAHQMDAFLDQMEARGLELIQVPATADEGKILVDKARQARSDQGDSLVNWIDGAGISDDLVAQFWDVMDELEGRDE
jgi:hypothetical protein